MSRKGNKDYIYLIWKEPNTSRRFAVGELSKNGNFEFRYRKEIDEALSQGFQLLDSFPNKDKIYSRENVFPAFSSRLPDPKRPDIDQILRKYGMDVYDEYELLKRSGARLPIDQLEFIDPIIEKDDDVERVFYLAGSRYYLGCEGNECAKSLLTNQIMNLELEPEPDNKYDKNAIKVLSEKFLVGYIPRYYSEIVKEMLEEQYCYRCELIERVQEKNCNECLRVKLTMWKSAVCKL